MTETVRYSRIYLPDLSVGTGSGQVVLADGRVVSMDEVNLDLLAHQLSGRSGLLPIKVLDTKWYAMAGYNTLSDALVAIGTDTRTLLIATPLSIATATSIPSNVTVLLVGEGSFAIASGITLTFASPNVLQAPSRRIFSGSGSVVFTASGTVTPIWWGATGDGSTDDTTALQAALTAGAGGKVHIPAGTYLISTKLTVSAGTQVTGVGYGSVIKKGANIDMFEFGYNVAFDHLRLDGNGATYTGRGIIMTTGGAGNGKQDICKNWIYDTASYCIEVTASGAAWGLQIKDNMLDTYNLAAYSIKLPDTDSDGQRTISGNYCLGPGLNFGGATNTQVVGNLFGQGPTGVYNIGSVTMNAAVFKAVVTGNAFETNLRTTINGINGTWAGNSMNGGYEIASGATFNHVANIVGSDPIAEYDIDSSGNTTNEIYGSEHVFTPTWTGSVSNPAIGNGTIHGTYQRNGSVVTARYLIKMGSTTTYGSGVYALSLPPNVPAPTPYTQSAFASGAALMTDDSAGVSYPGVGFYNGTAFNLYNSVSAGGPVSPTVPFTWATDDVMRLQVTYVL